MLAIEDKNEITKESVVETKDEKVVTWPGDDLEKEEDEAENIPDEAVIVCEEIYSKENDTLMIEDEVKDII